MTVHPILRRQLATFGLSADAPPDHEGWKRFLERVERTYTQADQDRYTVERSLMISSREMQTLHDDLRRSEANFRVLVERSPDAKFVVRSGRIIYANPAMAELLGRGSPSGLLGNVPVETFVFPEDRERLVEHCVLRDRGQPVPALELRWVQADGEVVHVRAHGTAITFDGEPATLVEARDITEAIVAQAEQDSISRSLRVSEERYRLLFDATPLPVMVFDVATLRCLAANEAAAQVYGYSSSEELLTKTLSDVGAAMDDSEVQRRGANWAPNGPPSSRLSKGVTKHRRRDGALIELEFVTHAVRYDQKEAVLVIGTDVTEKRRIEEQLRQSQKMDAIGRLAGGIAHDFNNLLAVILTDVELAASDLGEEHPVYPELKEIESASLRAAALTRQLLMFSRRQPCQPRPIALNTLVTALEKLLRRIIGVDVRVSTRLAPELGSMEGDPGQIDQVLLNLVVNARDAMPNGGDLVIETSNVELDPRRAERIGVAPGRYAMLSVTDTGIGMDAATRAHIFEPFFTTKEVGKGTGLGLATVFGVVKQSNGGIEVESEVGKGSTFRVYFPRSAHKNGAIPGPMVPWLSGAETILLIEDDEQVRRVTGRVLGSRGYDVIEARNGKAALEVLARRGDEIDLIVTDLVMPEIDGCTLATRIRERHPGAKILYMSGYADHVMVKGALLDRTDHFIHKPFTMHELALAVRRVIDGSCVRASELPTLGR
jgi:two-component system cell cycle sensor histidine kinase/response regulator CckA